MFTDNILIPILKIFINIFDSVAGIVFVASFTRADKPRGKKLLLCLFATAVLIAFSNWELYEPIRLILIYSKKRSAVKILFRIAAMYLVTFGIGKAGIISKISAPLIFEVINIYLTSSVWMSILSNCINSPVINLLTTSVTMVFIVLMGRILLSSLLLFISKVVTYSGKHRVITTVTYIMSPILTLFTLYLFMKILFYRVNEYSIETVIAVVGTACVNLFSLFLLNRIIASETENNKYQLYINKMEMERTKYADMLKESAEINAVKHDMKNQLIGINKFVIDGDMESFEKYVRSLNKSIESIGNQVVTGNSMLDYVISSKFSGKDDIILVVTGSVGDIKNVENIDLAVLIGNLIDNAIEAVEPIDNREKLIEFSLSKFEGYQNIIIKNNIENPILTANGELISTKADTSKHGFGLRSVKSIVKKYDGYIKCYEEGRKFCVHVAFPI